jgi:hypothetical protein
MFPPSGYATYGLSILIITVIVVTVLLFRAAITSVAPQELTGPSLRLAAGESGILPFSLVTGQDRLLGLGSRIRVGI